MLLLYLRLADQEHQDRVIGFDLNAIERRDYYHA